MLNENTKMIYCGILVRSGQKVEKGQKDCREIEHLIQQAKRKTKNVQLNILHSKIQWCFGTVISIHANFFPDIDNVLIRNA